MVALISSFHLVLFRFPFFNAVNFCHVLYFQIGTEPNETTSIGSRPVTRWHQTFDVGHVPNSVVPKVFMGVACDLRDDAHGLVTTDCSLSKNVPFLFSGHPATKLDVGYRLSRSGLAVAYGHDVEFLGPLVSDISYVNGSATLNVTYANVSSIDLRSPDGFDVLHLFLYLSTRVILHVVVIFQVCCGGIICAKYGRWYTSPIIEKNGLTVTISINSSCVHEQVNAIRYLWRDTPCDFKKAPIYSSTDPDLPSPPYFKYFN